jgi:DNA-binding transcriptional MerR regulator
MEASTLTARMTKAASGMTIAEVAERTGLTAHTLRYYERAGLLLEVDRDVSSGHRRYSDRDIEWITLCTRLRSTGMPIRRIREYADLVRAGEGNEPERLAILEAHRREVIDRIAELESNLVKIDYKVDLYRGKLGLPPIEA